MAFKGLRLMLSVVALATHSLAVPSAKLTATAQKLRRDNAVELTTDAAAAAASSSSAVSGGTGSRKTETLHHNTGGHGHHHHNYKPHQPAPHPQHQAISTLIHLLLTIGSAFAPLVGAIVGPLATNIANGITWAISYTIASGFSPPHGLFSPELGHESDYANEHHEHPTSYTAEGYSGTELDGLEVQQPIDVALGKGEPATVEDTRNEVKKI